MILLIIEILFVVFFIGTLVCVFNLFYLQYQLKRLSKIEEIVHFMIVNKDPRISKIYEDISLFQDILDQFINQVYKPNKSNWFGLKFPKDEDFK